MYLFAAVFAGAGAVTIYRGAISPHLERRAAASWVAGRCTITEVAIAQDVDSDGDRQYAPRVAYRLEVGGQSVRGERISFGERAWTNDLAKAKRGAARYHVGQTVDCFYDPDRPSRVVLSRTVPGGTMVAAFGLGFLLVGLGIAASELRERRQARRLAAHPAGPEAPPLLTRLGEHGLDHLLLRGGFAAAFSAPVPYLVADALDGPMHALFALIFGAVGLGLQAWFWHRLLRAIGPRVDVRVDGTPSLGETVMIAVDLAGWMPIRTARLRLIGREEATHRVGTDTVTDTAVFFERQLAAVRSPRRAARMSGEVQVPHDTMPTWSAGSNRIRWVIAIDADIATWPDVTDEYELRIGPALAARREVADG